MYNYIVDRLQNFNLHNQPQTVPDTFQGITLVFRKTIYMSRIKRCKIILLPSFKISSFKYNIWSTRYMRRISCTSTSYMSEIKRCFNISSFKCNLRQCLSLIYLFPRLPTRIFQSQLIWILILILSRKFLESSANLPIMTLTNHPFYFRLRTLHNQAYLQEYFCLVLSGS